jgi:hypothetical protein
MTAAARVTQLYVRAPPGALTWESAAQRNRLLKLWRQAVMATFGESSRCVRLAWALDHLFNAKTGYAYASNPYLADETHIPENKMREALRELELGRAIVRGSVVHNGKQQRVIYPSAALLPRPSLGQGGLPQQPGHLNLRRIRLPKSQFEYAARAAQTRQGRESAASGSKVASEEEHPSAAIEQAASSQRRD